MWQATTLPSTERLTMYANWAGPMAGSHCTGIRKTGVNPESSNRMIASPGLQTTPSKLWNLPASVLPLTLQTAHRDKLQAGSTSLLALVLPSRLSLCLCFTLPAKYVIRSNPSPSARQGKQLSTSQPQLASLGGILVTSGDILGLTFSALPKLKSQRKPSLSLLIHLALHPGL